MRKILLLVTDLQIGGTPTVVRELAIRLHRPALVEVQVACLDRFGPVAEQLKQAGISVTALNACCAGDLRVAWRLVQLIRREKFDTVFSFLLHANTVAAMARPFCPQVRFLQSIQTTQPHPSWHWMVQGLVHQMAEQIVVPSPSVAECAGSWSGIPREKIVVVPNAVEIHERNMIPRPAGGAAIGFVGRLDPIKCLGDLIEALKLLPLPAQLEIFGTGSQRQLLEMKVEQLGLAQRVRFHGEVPSSDQVWPLVDVLVLPSQAEGFGLVLIEAMAAGVPVVATDVAGIRDVVKHAKTGLLVPVNQPGLLADAIRRLLDDAPLRERLVKAAREDVALRFAWPAVLEQYRQILRIED